NKSWISKSADSRDLFCPLIILVRVDVQIESWIINFNQPAMSTRRGKKRLEVGGGCGRYSLEGRSRQNHRMSRTAGSRWLADIIRVLLCRFEKCLQSARAQMRLITERDNPMRKEFIPVGPLGGA